MIMDYLPSCLLCVQIEESRVEMEEEVEVATLSAGLMERVKDALNNR